MSDELLRKLLADLNASVKGLRIEIEGWRTHTGSTGDFLLHAVEALVTAVNELTARLKT